MDETTLWMLLQFALEAGRREALRDFPHCAGKILAQFKELEAQFPDPRTPEERAHANQVLKKFVREKGRKVGPYNHRRN